MPLIAPSPDSLLRIACFAYAERNAGSVASANHALLEELLRRGHQIDLFAKRNFINPTELERFSNYRYVEAHNLKAERWRRRLAFWKSRHWDFLLGRIDQFTFARGIVRAMRREHAKRPYDVQLFLGEWAFGRAAEDLPVVSWVQGPPETDARSIAAQSRRIRSLCGVAEYARLRAYSIHRRWFGLPRFDVSDRLIVGSRWAIERMADYGVPNHRVRALPYPIELDAFPLRAQRPANETIQILWLGRVVPRKRLDLFLDACAILIERGRSIDIKVVGGFSFAAGFRRLIERFPHPARLHHLERVDRRTASEMLKAADVLVQTSEDENFGSSVAESLCCGTPVVVGPTNGTKDYIGESGEVFEQYTPAAVADAIERAILRARHSPGFAVEARRRAESEFNVARIADAVESNLREVVVARGCRAPGESVAPPAFAAAGECAECS